tara:strand:+ start:4414 stop:4992 length:579 start_codon:yes stop_codon:yes gene_type:complete
MNSIKKYGPGGKNPAKKGKRSVSQEKLSEISQRQIAPIEALLRRIAQRQELKEGESDGDSISLGNVDFGDGTEGESCKIVDGKVQCASYGTSSEDLGEMATEDEKGDRKPFSLVLADLIKGGRDLRQDFLKSQKKYFGGRREVDINPDRSEATMIRNPFARALYRRAQKKLAKSEGRESAAQGIQNLGSVEF